MSTSRHLDGSLAPDHVGQAGGPEAHPEPMEANKHAIQ